MASLFLSSTFLPFPPSHKIFLSLHHNHHRLSFNNFQQYPLRKHFTYRLYASSLNKTSRSRRKVKSNEELRNDLREFLSRVGLPNDHVPTMKELSEHGRNDLANIVRRRGYKFVRELLANSTKIDCDDLIAEKGLPDESDAKESEEVTEGGNKSGIPGPDLLERVYNHRADGAVTLNGSALTSNKLASSATVNHPLRDDGLVAEGLLNVDFDKDLDIETSRIENQLEINNLKSMLQQMELELSRLKDQIEKEQRALCVLQTKAETEISKAQKLISEKDAELNAVEESLSGLEEVEIQYSGDGEIVEVAGSFNGWHHRIKMDPKPSSSIIETIGSRKSRTWSTVLWLYPGMYEIKFIVDGEWKNDPKRESVTRGGILNNILRVDR
ncbi:protein PTST homolog 3, chloroplastic isoform X2 [Pistacia vera]|uniref:protein PTST homolog 3, chloroplastic isoform X2 n=1 Tax=Pistacia vera TaxID=55513 RepID=UPI001263B1CE|nr:protein PTST homolog 3, chloroplastic isoform X2 [Pistacia vera]